MTDTDQRRAVVERAARAGGEIARRYFREDVDVRTKSRTTDVVTAADHAAQDRVVDLVSDAFPGEPVVGEECGIPDTLPESGPAWVVDPIDGTNNFVRDVPLWATSVAAVLDGDPVAAATVLPALGEAYVSGPEGAFLNGEPIEVSGRADPETFAVSPVLYWPPGERVRYGNLLATLVDRFYDQRRYGAVQYALALVAAGGLEAAVSDRRGSPWDTIAGVHLIRRAGGIVTDLDGERWRHDSAGLVASNGLAHDEVLAAVQGLD